MAFTKNNGGTTLAALSDGRDCCTYIGEGGKHVLFRSDTAMACLVWGRGD